MSDIQVFDFEDNAVRVVDIDGEPWFVAADVCRVLALTNPSEAVKCLDDDEQSKYCLGSGGSDRVIINESGLYNLIFRSRKSEAKKFRKWVTAEVLPSIRKTGAYVDPGVDCRTADGELPDRTFAQWINLIRETRLLFGRAAARDVWAKSPLPAPSPIFRENKDAIAAAFDENSGYDALRLILSMDTADGILRDLIDRRNEKAMKRSGVRFFYKDGVEYLSIACVCFRRVVAGTIFDNGGLSRALLCLPGSFVQKNSVRFGANVCHPVVVPVHLAAVQAA